MSSKSKKQIKAEPNIEKKITQRFIWLSFGFGFLYFLVWLFIALSIQKGFLINSIWFLNTGVFIWFFGDFEILKSDLRYIFALLIAILIVLYSHYIQQVFQFRSFSITFPETMFALVFLLIQWPFRRIFLKLFVTEPEISRTGDVKDILYTFVLLISTLVVIHLL